MALSDRDPHSPASLIWRRLQHNRLALTGAIVLALLYFIAIFAGFFSPYSPTADQFRGHFFHPPMTVQFHDSAGRFSLRPHVPQTFLIDSTRIHYSSQTPLFVVFHYPDGNRKRHIPDIIEKHDGVMKVLNEKGNTIAMIASMKETGTDSGVFSAAVEINDPVTGNRLEIVSLISKDSVRVPLSVRSAKKFSADTAIYITNENGEPLESYASSVDYYPVRFFVRRWKYRILGIFESDLHLFGVDPPAYLFLFGTDQSGRDNFSRILFGAQISLTVGLVGMLITSCLGLLYGGIAGYYGGKMDDAMMRFVEILLSIPALYLILSLRNIIPERLQDSYDKIDQLLHETFAWQQNSIAYWAVTGTFTLLLLAYNYRNKWRSLKLSLILILLVAFARPIAYSAFGLVQTLLPGSIYLTSQWTYLLIIVILSLVGWAAMSRVVRGMVLSLREQEYVMAARSAGASDFRILLRHILPGLAGFVIVRSTLLIPAYILGEVYLSFLAVGVQEPVPSWGNMLSAAQNIRVLQQFTWTLIPGAFIFLTVLSFNFLGDGLRDALDPKS